MMWTSWADVTRPAQIVVHCYMPWWHCSASGRWGYEVRPLVQLEQAVILLSHSLVSCSQYSSVCDSYEFIFHTQMVDILFRSTDLLLSFEFEFASKYPKWPVHSSKPRTLNYAKVNSSYLPFEYRLSDLILTHAHWTDRTIHKRFFLFYRAHGVVPVLLVSFSLALINLNILCYSLFVCWFCTFFGCCVCGRQISRTLPNTPQKSNSLSMKISAVNKIISFFQRVLFSFCFHKS